MPYTTIFVDDGKGVLKTGTGILTALEIYTSAVQLGLDEERTRKLLYGLVDFTAVTEMRITPDELRPIVELNRRAAALCPGALVAIIAPDTLAYAMSRFWHTISDDLPWKANIFHTRAEAIVWLRNEFLLQDETGALLAQLPSLLK